MVSPVKLDQIDAAVEHFVEHPTALLGSRVPQCRRPVAQDRHVGAGASQAAGIDRHAFSLSDNRLERLI